MNQINKVHLFNKEIDKRLVQKYYRNIKFNVYKFKKN